MPESVLEINIKLEQAQRELDASLAKVNKLEESIAKSSQKWGEYSSRVKTTKVFLDQATSSAEKLWLNQSRELDKVERIVKRLGPSINKELTENINKFAESINRAGSKFDTSIVGKVSRLEKELKRVEEIRSRTWTTPKVEQIKKPWSAPTATETWRKPDPTFSEKFVKFFTQRKDDENRTHLRESQFINALANTARVGAGASGGGAHYGMISGMSGLLKTFFLQPSGIQLIETIAAGALIAVGTAIAVAEPVMRRGKRAREFGQPYGAYEATEYAFGPYRDVDAGMQATRMARDPTSQQYIAMTQLGLQPQAEFRKTPGEQFADQTLALKDLIGKFADFGQFLAYFHNTPLSSMFKDSDVYNIRDTRRDTLVEKQKQAALDEQITQLDEKTIKTYSDLSTDLDRFGLSLENLTARQLVGFASGIDNILKYLITAPTTPAEVPGQANPIPWHKLPEFMEKRQPPAEVPGQANPIPWGKMFGFQTGAYSVPDTGPAMLHENELVMPAQEASAFRDMLKNSTGEGSKDFGEFNRQLMQSSNILVDFNKQIVPLKDNMEALNSEMTSGKYLADKFSGTTGGGGGGGGGGNVVESGSGGGYYGPSSSKTGVPGSVESGGGGAYGPSAGGGVVGSIPDTSTLTGDAKTDAILKTIRTRESKGNYGITSNSSSASGAYQFTGGTWKTLTRKFGVGTEYGSAASAPPAIQDKVAGLYVQDILKRAGGDVSKVPLEWYTGNIQGKISPQALAANKGLLPETYQADWMKQYNKNAGGKDNTAGGYFGGKPSGTTSGGYFGGAPSGNMPDLSDSKDWTEHLKNMKNSNLLTDEQCVTLAMASVGVKKGSGAEGANVHDWRRGESAEAGNLTPGTPISTFLDRGGKPSNLYADGGIGTPGANLDHAAVFEHYIKDKMGKDIGMAVMEQYQYSGKPGQIKGPHEHDYMFGQGYGETNASNYSRIKLASGGYLGGLGPNTIAEGKTYGQKARPQTQADTSQPSRPTSMDKTPHLGDMSQFHKDVSPVVTIFNKSGSNINLQTTSLGSTKGNFDT
jgi:hypothetical protein